MPLDARRPRGYPDGMPPRLASRLDGIRPFLAMEVMERAFAMERVLRDLR